MSRMVESCFGVGRHDPGRLTALSAAGRAVESINPRALCGECKLLTISVRGSTAPDDGLYPIGSADTSDSRQNSHVPVGMWPCGHEMLFDRPWIDNTLHHGQSYPCTRTSFIYY